MVALFVSNYFISTKKNQQDQLAQDIENSGNLVFRDDANNVVGVCITKSNTLESWAQSLEKLTHIKWITISGIEISDSQLKAVSEINAIQKLTISNSNVSPNGLSNFRGSLELNSLAINGQNLSQGHIDAISKIPNLTSIQLGRCNANGVSLKNLRNLNDLRALSLASTKIPESELEWLVSSTLQLESIDLSGLNLSDRHLVVLLECNKSTLKELLLVGTNIGSDEELAKKFKEVKNLRVLNISATKINDNFIIKFEKPDSLIELVIQYNNISDACVESLCKFDGLSRLKITGTNISAQGSEKIKTELSACNFE